jgi:hydroxymethylpyrimidine/phosphomethylpyrimidine kinase
MLEFEVPPRVLCIGGTDPTGAAGLLLDQRTLAALGVYGAGVVTAVTVQTSRGVSDVVALPASVVGAQMDAAIEELGAPTIKTGMLGSLDIVLAVAGRVKALGSRSRLVIDPVFASTSGRSLLPEDGRRALLEQLVPLSALVTPNVPEAEALTGVPIADLDGMGRAADFLLEAGAAAVLIKGGHLDDDSSKVTDLLRTADGDQFLCERARVTGPGFRGSGCFLATAIAALLAEGVPLAASVEGARSRLDAAMRQAQTVSPLSDRPLVLTPVPKALSRASMLPDGAGD